MKRNSSLNNLLQISLFVILTSFVATSQAQTVRTWTNANGTGLWSDPLNWSGNTVPTTTANRALFNGTSTANCTIDVNVSCDGIEITSAYSGTITQSGSVTISLDNSDYIQGGGTFNCGSGSFSTVNGGIFTLSGGSFNQSSGNISLNGTASISGGTFTGGSGTFSSNSSLNISSGTFTSGSENCTFNGFTQTGGSFTSTPKTFRNNGNFIRNTGGTFAHNNGLWLQANAADVSPNFSQPTTFYRFTYDAGVGNNFSHTAGQSMTVTKSCRILSGNFDNAAFTVYVGDTLELNNTGRTEPDFEFNGTGGKVLLATVAATSDINVNLTNQSDELYVYKGTASSISLGNGTGASFTVTSGQVKFESGIATTIDVNNLDILTGASFFLTPAATTRFIGTMNNTGGRFHGASGTLACDISGRATIFNTDGTDTVYNLTIDKTGGGVNDDVEVISGDVLAVSNLLSLNLGDINNGTGNNGEFRVLKDMTVNGKDVINTNFRIAGSGNSTVTFNAALNNAATIIIDKAASTDQVTFTSGGTTADGTGGDLEIIRGTLNFGTANADLNYDNISITGAEGIFNPASGTTFIFGNLLNTAGLISAPAGSTVSFDGNISTGAVLDVQSNDQFYNFTVDKNHTSNARQLSITSGDVVLVNNDLDVTSGSRLLGGTINLKGNLTFGTLNQSSTTDLLFTGSADQSVSLASSGQIDGNITLNKTNGTHVLITTAVLLDNSAQLVTFTNGYLRITTGSLTISGSALVNNSAWYTGASSNSFVFGTIQIRNCTTPAFNTTFPTGDTVMYNGGSILHYLYAPISFQSTTTQANQTGRGFNANYNYQPSSNLTSLGAGIDHVSRVEHWNLDRISSTVNGRVTLSWRPRSFVNSLSDLVIARYDGTTWVKSTASTSHTTSGDTLNGTITADDVFTTFSPFTLGSGAPVLNPLPVNFLNISAKRLENNIASVSWSVADEKDVLKYDIERSADGIHFQYLGSVSAINAGQNIQSYSYVDYQCPSGIVFYRVKEVSQSSHSYSKLVNVSGSSNVTSDQNVMVLPNPVSSGNNIYIKTNESSESAEINYSIFDASGKLVMEKQMLTTGGVIVVETAKLNTGLYLLNVSRNGILLKTEKLLVNP